MRIPVTDEQRELEIKARAWELILMTKADCQCLECQFSGPCPVTRDKTTFVLCHMAQLYALAEDDIDNAPATDRAR